MQRVKPKLFWVMSVLLLNVLSVVSVQSEVSLDRPIEFNVPKQSVDLALTKFAEQADITFLFPPEGMRELMSNDLVGSFSVSDGASVLLAGTGLSPTFSSKGVLTIEIERTKNKREKDMNDRKTLRGGLLVAVLGLFSSGGV